MAPTQQMFVALWGVTSELGGTYPLADLEIVADKAKKLGYAGIEAPVATVMQYGSANFLKLLQDRGLQWIAQIFSSGPPPTPGNLDRTSEFGIKHEKDPADTRDVAAHQRIWAAQVDECLKLKDILRSINSHTGRDYFTNDQADALFEFCVEYEAKNGVEINHETHRGRILYSPWVIPRLLERHPALHINADLSHYCCVAEAGPDDPELNKVVELLVPRIRHIHARVGFEEGPQVPDPRGARWQPYMEGHKRWWSQIYQAQAKTQETITTTPEFGPAIYCWTEPFTNKELVDVRDVNHFVATEMSALFAKVVGKEGASAVDGSTHL
eukprot:m.487245 g.487245  ORF g.487245 m.487245 type:complete len:326 (-) comp24907_c0_seq1:189-1166(-)